ncbi:MAG: hypothetical protein HYW48_04850 [Deltaproteobacteria bacterium]|nr:hypothetical protein [Deltaproteobacteria bacterium]
MQKALSTLVAVSFVILGFGNASQAASMQCPSYDGLTDDVHLVFQFEGKTDFRKISSAVVNYLRNSHYQEARQIEASLSRDLDSNTLVIFSYHTGTFKTYPYPVEEVEKVILSDLEDCVSTQRISIGPDTTSLVFSQSFGSRPNLNLALVDALFALSEDVEVMSDQGKGWLCAVAPEHEACPLIGRR